MSKRKQKKRRQNAALKNGTRPGQEPVAQAEQQPAQHLTAEEPLQASVHSERAEEAAAGEEQMAFNQAAQEPLPEQAEKAPPEEKLIEEQQLEELQSTMQAEKSASKAPRQSFWPLGKGLPVLLAGAALVLVAAVLWPRPATPTVAGPAESQPGVSSLQTGEEEDRTQRLEQAMAQNSDVMAWLTLPGTQVDDPVLQAADNEYYLTRNESGQADPMGCYFADYYSVFTSRSALNLNTIIYGWAQSEEDAAGERFSQLFQYLEPAFAAENAHIYLTLKGETLTFQVFAAFYTNTDFYYINSNPTGGAWQPFFQTVQSLNQWPGEAVEVQQGDKLLTLSTGAYQTNDPKARFVVMAKLLPQQGEADQPAATATAAPSAAPSPSPVVSPTPAATATPTPSASPAASATPQPTASPAPTPATGSMTEEEFWQQVLALVQEAPKASLIKVDAGTFENVPQAVLEALFGKDVNLLVVQSGQSDLIINGINMYRHTKKEIYTLPDLRGAYKGFTLENSKAPVDKPELDLSVS